MRGRSSTAVSLTATNAVAPRSPYLPKVAKASQGGLMLSNMPMTLTKAGQLFCGDCIAGAARPVVENEEAAARPRQCYHRASLDGLRSLSARRSTDRRRSGGFIPEVENPAHRGSGRSLAKDLPSVCQQVRHPGVEKRLAASRADVCDNVHQGDIRSLPDTSFNLAGRIEISPASRAGL
jgi:hypothetical protein